MIRRCALPFLALALAGVAPAQDQRADRPTAQPAPAEPGAATARAEADVDAALAARLARIGVIYLRELSDPAVEDYELAALVMGQALELDPDNEPLLRLQIDAWRRAGDEDRVTEAVSRLVRLNPSDTAAQLELIAGRISKLQRIEDRLAAYENLLGPRGERLDASIRSRLAFDAALLAREVGDEDRFLDLLSRALELDQTNKPAALLATTLFFERNDDPVARADMLVQMILADPLDWNGHLRLGRHLLEHGAYAGAERFFDIALIIRGKRGLSPDQSLLDDAYSVRWGVVGAEALLEEFAQGEAQARFTIESARRRAEEAGEDPTQIQDYQANPVEDRTRVAMAAAIGDEEQAARLLERFSSSMLAVLRTQAESGRFTEAQLSSQQQRVAAELIRLRTLSGVNLDEASAALDRLEATDARMLIRSEAIVRYRGLIAAHRGEREAAEALLGPLAEDGDALAQLGLAIAAEEAGERREALRRYAEAAREAPGTTAGLFARERLSRMLDAAISPTDIARELNALALEAPRLLDRMAQSPAEYLAMSVRLPDRRLDPLEPVLARVELKNTSIFPLAVGQDAPIIARLLLAPKYSISGTAISEGVAPEIASLDRRIRLRPSEAVTADVWLGAGGLGAIFDASAAVPASLRVQAIQGFRWSEERRTFVPDPFATSAGSDAVWRRPERVEPSVDEVIERIGAESEEERFRGLLEARWTFARRVPASEEERLAADQRRLVERIAELYPSFSEESRAFALLMIPSSNQSDLTAPLDEAALAAPPAALTEAVLLMTRAASPEHPAFARARALGDARIEGIADRLLLRLELARRFSEIQRSGQQPR